MPPIAISHRVQDPPSDWDEQLASAKEAPGFLHSSLWARYASAVDSAVPHYLEVNQGGERLLSLLLLQMPSWQPDTGFAKKVVQVLRSNTRGWLRWQDGPAIYTEDPVKLRAAIKALLGWIEDYARHNGSHRIQAVPAHSFPTAWLDLLGRTAGAFGYSSRLWATYLVSLNRSEDELWTNLKSTARKAVRKARRLGLTTERVENINGLERDFLQTYNVFEQAAGRSPRDPNRLMTMWKLGGEQNYHFYLARTQEREIIATLGMHIFNGVATEIASSMSPQAYAAKLPAQDLLHWDMMVAARQLGCHTFDLAGVNPFAHNGKDSGIAQFKEKWGGEYKEYPLLSKQFRKGLLAFLPLKKSK